ncbi:MAG: 50S ribosomal protein L6 [Planctomycetes bacterium]|nr:50S ribosomal protein L6 [Planctomycetota bacterium]
MSRIGRKPIAVPEKVEISVKGGLVSVKGPLGSLQATFRPEVAVAWDAKGRVLAVTRSSDVKLARALHGLTRALLANMVEGVTKGYQKKLELVGVGYRAAKQGNALSLSVGYSKPREVALPAGLKVEVPDATHISIVGCDKQQVGQFAAQVRAVRPPEPYKGKGIRYEGEVVRRKVGKTFVAGSA